MDRSIHGKSKEQGELLSIEYKALSALQPNPKNARTHTKHQIRQVAESIRVIGWTNPVLVDAENQIIAGHCRVEAAKLLGITEVPTIRLDRLTRDQIRAYVLADNKLAERGLGQGDPRDRARSAAQT